MQGAFLLSARKIHNGWRCLDKAESARHVTLSEIVRKRDER